MMLTVSVVMDVKLTILLLLIPGRIENKTINGICFDVNMSIFASSIVDEHLQVRQKYYPPCL